MWYSPHGHSPYTEAKNQLCYYSHFSSKQDSEISISYTQIYEKAKNEVKNVLGDFVGFFEECF